MRLIGASSTDEMVLAFLRAEADGPRHRHAFATLDRRLIEQPDLGNQAENLARAAALGAHRGGYLGPLPPDTGWERWALTPVELGDVRYANYVTWEVLSGGTRRIADGAANVRTLVVVTELGVDVSAGIRETARAIDGGHAMPELIAVSKDRHTGYLVLLKGHTRATAYLVARAAPSEITVLVGWSPSMDRWPWF